MNDDRLVTDAAGKSDAADGAVGLMRSHDEIQAAHDRLVAIILGDCPNPFHDDISGDGAGRIMQAATDVLCWVLNHDHNAAFVAVVLADIDAHMRERGLELRKSTAHPEAQGSSSQEAAPDLLAALKDLLTLRDMSTAFPCGYCGLGQNGDHVDGCKLFAAEKAIAKAEGSSAAHPEATALSSQEPPANN